MDDSPKRTACRNVGPYSVFVSQTDILSDELKKAQAEKKKLVQLAKQNAQDIRSKATYATKLGLKVSQSNVDQMYTSLWFYCSHDNIMLS